MFSRGEGREELQLGKCRVIGIREITLSAKTDDPGAPRPARSTFVEAAAV